MHYVTQNPEDTQKLAANLGKELTATTRHSGALIIALEGELGTGKTTFVQGFAKALGVTEQPKSPTFNLVKEYRAGQRRLVHMDCYRLSGHADLKTLYLHDAFADPNTIFLIEWAQNIGDALPVDHIVIRFSHAGGDKREITVTTEPTRS